MKKLGSNFAWSGCRGKKMHFWRWPVCLALTAICFLPLAALGQGMTWTTETVDLAGNYTSLAVDQNGNLHLVYEVDEGWQLVYAFRPANSGKWFKMLLD